MSISSKLQLHQSAASRCLDVFVKNRAVLPSCRRCLMSTMCASRAHSAEFMGWQLLQAHLRGPATLVAHFEKKSRRPLFFKRMGTSPHVGVRRVKSLGQPHWKHSPYASLPQSMGQAESSLNSRRPPTHLLKRLKTPLEKGRVCLIGSAPNNR